MKTEREDVQPFRAAIEALADVFNPIKKRLTRAQRIEADLRAFVKACEFHGFFPNLTEHATIDLLKRRTRT
jgi:hypothetical protein